MMTHNHSPLPFFLSSLGKKCFIFQGKILGSTQFWQWVQLLFFFVIPAKAGIQRNVEIHIISILSNEKCNLKPGLKKLFFIKCLMDPRFRGDDKTGWNLTFLNPTIINGEELL
jgi:hypothetical protein